MENKDIQIYSGRSELSKSHAALVKIGEEATADAYAPYSKFYVGAAILLEDGNIVKGSNFENASYPLCLCAERVALASVHSQQPGAIVKMIAVTAKNPRKKVSEPVAPCGACRQVLCEYEKKQGTPMEVIMCGETGKIVVFKSAAQLLPMAFDHTFL